LYCSWHGDSLTIFTARVKGFGPYW
jgi:hypothetical protein